eukprot:jgi/Botrbrau1/8181/Bobra.357_2s0026.1
MAITNFLLTIVGVGAVAFLMKSDIRTGTAQLRRNLRHIRTWLEEQGPAASEAVKEEAKQIGLPKQHEVKPPTHDKQA